MTSDGAVQRNPSRFNMFMSGVSKSAKKGMSRAGKQMGKSVVKAKLLAIEKIAKAETTPEDPEIIAALERLKTTKNEIYQISDIVRNLYDARVNETTHLFQLASRLERVEVTENDPFGSYVQQMGQALHKLETVANTHLKKMKEEFVEPLERFRDVDVDVVQKLKLKYKTGKSEYDLAQHRLSKAKETGEQSKIQVATEKRDAAYVELTALRNQLKFQVNNLEQKKQVGLLSNFEHYWASYSGFAAAQANILSKCAISSTQYVPPKQHAIKATPMQSHSKPTPKPKPKKTNRSNPSANKNSNRNNNGPRPPRPPQQQQQQQQKRVQNVKKQNNERFQGLVEYQDMRQQQQQPTKSMPVQSQPLVHPPPPVPVPMQAQTQVQATSAADDVYANPPPPAYNKLFISAEAEQEPAPRYGDDEDGMANEADFNPFGSAPNDV